MLLASAFDAVFGGRDTFYNISAVKALWGVSCIFGVLFLVSGVINFRRSRNADGVVLMLVKVFLCGFLMLPFCSIAEGLKNSCQDLKENVGFTPKELNASFHRVATKAENAETDIDRTWYDIANKASDSFGRYINSLIVGSIVSVAWLVSLILKVFYLLHDFVFYAAILITPLAFGLIGSGILDSSRGYTFLFSVLGVAIWPLGWLFIDGAALLLLKPLDPEIGGSSVITGPNPNLFAPMVLSGVSGLLWLLIFLIVLTLGILAGYVKSISIAHWVFGSVGGAILQEATRLVTGTASKAAGAAAFVAAGAATGGAAAPAGAAVKGATGATSVASTTSAASSGSSLLADVGMRPRSAGQMLASASSDRSEPPPPVPVNWRARPEFAN